MNSFSESRVSRVSRVIALQFRKSRNKVAYLGKPRGLWFITRDTRVRDFKKLLEKLIKNRSVLKPGKVFGKSRNAYLAYFALRHRNKLGARHRNKLGGAAQRNSPKAMFKADGAGPIGFGAESHDLRAVAH